MNIKLNYCCDEFKSFLKNFGFEILHEKAYMYFIELPKYNFCYCPFCGKQIELETNEEKEKGTDVDSGRD